ncbi:HEAT repeat domain-containing protein [Pseudomonas sp. B2M1-30]|uniref:HEAT repeat domain-containing protein n=1 Tax=Pseudomonas TaxID=286 RepID=UPI0021CA17B1|nr:MULTISPECIES: HEAT repeat domain-containing protein [Pseudomonas]MCU0122211.1 HEAT repeat domain-containing protein [Pseudomonas sp. B2M1-30]MCU7264464.1 HEAT repeat domain-containing protein [Pseudomonas koreensis]
MKDSEKDEIYETLCSLIGDSESSNWTEYTTEIVAKTVLADFKDDQWHRLEKEILSKPEFWQQRCAAAMGEDRTEHSIRILKLLLSNSIYIDVKIISIHELDWAEVNIEKKYAPLIREVMKKIPSDEIEPELTRLLAKAESA